MDLSDVEVQYIELKYTCTPSQNSPTVMIYKRLHAFACKVFQVHKTAKYNISDEGEEC